MSLRNNVLFACLVGGSLGAAHTASAQFLELDIRSTHAAFGPGMPQTFTAATTRSDGSPTAFPGQMVTQYSLEGFFSTGAPANGITIPSTTPIGPILAANPGVRLYTGRPAQDSTLHVSIPDLTRAEVSRVTSDTFTRNECKLNPTFNDNVGLPPGTVVRACDAVDATLKVNGVSFQLTGAENKVPLRLVIPAVAFDFTASFPGPKPGPDPFYTREDSLRQIDDAFFASGKAPLVVARLLGESDSFVLPKGSLPNKGTLVQGDITVGAVTKSFAIDNPGQLLAYAIANRRASFADFGLNYDDGCFRGPTGAVSGTCSAANASLRIAGVEVTATVPANSTNVTFTAPELGLSFTSSSNADRDDALGDFLDYARENVDEADLTRAYARYLAATNPSDPLVGNPFSAQGQLNRQSLDLDAPSDALGETKSSGGRGRADDPSGWMVGGRVGHLSAGGQGAEFVDAVFERGFRFREGSRMRLKLSAPVSYIHYGGRNAGGETATLGLRAALEAPLIDGRWVVEPSAAASAFYSSNEVSSGALYAFGISSRYKLAPIGRGHLVIGNAINYSSTIDIEAGSFASPKITNTAVRNGLAYQLPAGRVLGRQGTMRASYTFTHLFGDDVLVEDYHEVALSYGVASREASVKQIGETLRLGLSGAFGKDFTAVSLTAGYRF